MGVPGFYRTIFKRYQNDTLYRFIDDYPDIDYFYIDFNPIIYISLLGLGKSGINYSKMSNDKFESVLINSVIQTTMTIVNEYVKPKKMLYIAIDGPAPKCKIVTQRARRYKGLYEAEIKKLIRAKYPGATECINWEKSSITPGTAFMVKLDTALRKAIVQRLFKVPTVLFSDSLSPSEGEHKILQHLKTLQISGAERICIYSNDGDMAFLTLQYPDLNILTMIDSGFLPSRIQENTVYSYVYFDNQLYHQTFIEDLFSIYSDDEDSNGDNNDTTTCTSTKKVSKRRRTLNSMTSDNYDTNRVLLDFMFVAFFGGNDFVRPIPFAKIRSNGTYKMFMTVYLHALQRNKGQYLINADKTVNKSMLQDIIYGLSIHETRKMSRSHRQTVGLIEDGYPNDWGPFQNWEDEWGQFQHTPYANPSHPEHSLVREELLALKYIDEEAHERWKKEYYSKNFGIDVKNKKVYNYERSRICRTYIKSLLFTFRYYTDNEPPSWRWVYPYEVAPWPSDLVITMKKTDLQTLAEFHKSRPYRPQEQLLLTIPGTSSVFPREYISLIAQLPQSVNDIDRINGDKWIYAEPLMDEIDEKKILQDSRKIHLQPETYRRNRFNNKLFVFKW